MCEAYSVCYKPEGDWERDLHFVNKLWLHLLDRYLHPEGAFI